jgi:anion-transporting  ArsA/GET3 family ATPase
VNAVGAALHGADVVVCCGSGGVGKTTMAAAIGRHAAQQGRRVVVVTIDPARRLADALGLPDGLTGVPQRVAVAVDVAAGATRDGELWAMMLDTPAMFDRVVRAHAADAEQAERIVGNRLYRNIASALSGTQEYMASEALFELHGDPRFDLVVVDTPPSRNALDFLEAPGVLARFLAHPVFKLLMMPTRTGFRVLWAATQPILRAIGRVVGSDVLADTVAFFQAFAGMETGFRERAEAVTALLRDAHTRFLLVTAPRRDAVAEAAWFADQLHAQGFAVAATIVNRAHPRFGDGTAADADRRADAATSSDVAALWRNLAELRRVADAERAALAPLLDRVGDDAAVQVPLLPTDVHDATALDHLATHLFPTT